MNKERLLQKGNSKLNMREDPHVSSPISITKGKASRAHRNGPGSAGNSSPNFSRGSGTPENKVHSLAGVNNRKRPLPNDSSSPPMAQWVGQRPQKISRNRRTNIGSPTSNPDVAQIPSEGLTTSDFSTTISGGMDGSIPVRNIMSSSQQLKTKLETAQSPARLSECEENSTVENRMKDKVLVGADIDEKGMNVHQHASPGLYTKKSKLLAKDEVGDGVRRQGRSGRGSFPKGSISPLREKPGSPAVAKPVRGTRPGPEKNGSKSGRPPLKKQFDRKGSIRTGLVPNSSSRDCTGESDDDRDEIRQEHTSLFPYSDEIPHFMVRWINNRANVQSDGNCGYRAVAQEIYGDENKWPIVRQDMLDELKKHRDIYIRIYGSEFGVDKMIERVSWLKGRAPTQYWMSTDMGFIIANYYDAIFTYMSSTQALTTLPVTRRSAISQGPKQIISIVLLNSFVHFIWVRFENASPLPAMHPLWRYVADKSREPELKQIESRITSYRSQRGGRSIQIFPYLLHLGIQLNSKKKIFRRKN